MKAFSFLFIGLSLIFQRSNGEEKLIKEGDASSWSSGLIIDTSDKTGYEPWFNNKFASIDGENGVWLVTKGVECDERCTIPCATINYHMDIKTTRTKCHNTTCSLQIFIYNGTTDIKTPVLMPGESDAFLRKRQQLYLRSHFMKLHDVTFNENNISTQSFNFSHNCCGDHSYNCRSKLIFAVRTRAIEGELHKIKLYFYYCNETVKNSVRLARTYAPSSGLKRVAVNCTTDAVSQNNEGSFNGFCSCNGTWHIGNETECYCRPGYGMSEGCTPCKTGHYKPKISNEECTSCPARSSSNSTNTGCNCLEGKYRLKNETGVSSAPCYGFPSKVRDIKIKKSDSRGTITLSWKPPKEDGGLPKSLKYDVACGNPCKAKFTPSKVNLTNTTVKISGLTPGHKYTFQVFSKNIISVLYSNGNFEVKNTTYEVKKLETTNEFMIKLEFIIIAGIGAFLILILFIALVCALRRKQHRHSKCGFENDSGISLPNIGQRMYIDPMNYVDAETALKEFANEVDPASLFLERLIGGGEFGDVYKGELTLQDGRTISIAAKTLKSNASQKSCQDFFLEASAMGQFDDPNVIHLEGVITKAVPKMIVTEFMSNGSLDHFLKKNDGGFTAIQLFSMAGGVASGMKYLASINFVHRDLAARNILVDDNMVCKVADFGLSRELETADSSRGEYFTQGGKIPVRWTAPEAIKYRTFSTASDVWSFGILLWEIMSSAQRPYWNWDNVKVMERVDDGFRLPPPMNCPQTVHELMLKCWDKDRRLRPGFHDILDTINQWIESPEVFHQAMPGKSNQVPNGSSTTSVREWLDEIKMSSYMPHFAAAGYENLSDLAGLLDNDLKELGINLVGHRNKMLRTIRSLPIIQENDV